MKPLVMQLGTLQLRRRIGAFAGETERQQVVETKPFFRLHAIAIVPPPTNTAINITVSIIKHPQKDALQFRTQQKADNIQAPFL
jgi:hypothetical protein